MATGDVTGAKRPRYQANERFDSGDADAASRSGREHDDALQRALLTTPRATGGTVMPGMILTGMALTLNPTGPADNKVRIGTELSVAIDANGRYLIKPAGLTVDVTIPVGTHQVYIYYQETGADTAMRRFLTVTSPFTEYSSAMSTTFQSTFGTHVRAGNNTNTVADDVINGVTTPLVCIGIVTNIAGACTMSGRPDNTAILTIPNGLDITNRLATVSVPATPPTLNTRNGSPRTVHDVLTAGLYTTSQTAWKRSEHLQAYTGTSTAVALNLLTDAAAVFVVSELIGGFLKDSAGTKFRITANTATTISIVGTPAAGAYVVYASVARNNFGAYSIPVGGADKAFRQALNWVNIGDGVTTFGDYNTSDYANSKLLLDAVLASLPATGGTIYLKPGLSLSNFGGAAVVFPAKRVEIRGSDDGINVGTQSAFISFVAGESFTAPPGRTLTMRNIYVGHDDKAITITNTASGGFHAFNCIFEHAETTNASASLGGVDVQNLVLEDVFFYTQTANPGTANAMALKITGVGKNIALRRVKHFITVDDCASIQIVDVRDNVTFDDVTINSGSGFTGGAFPTLILLSTTDNVTAIQNRRITNLTLTGPSAYGLSTGNVGHMTVDNLDSSIQRAVTAGAWTGPLTYKNCKFRALVTTSGATTPFLLNDFPAGQLAVEDCAFTSTLTNNATAAYISTSSFDSIRFSRNTFDGWGSTLSNFDHLVLITGASVTVGSNRVVFEGNTITRYMSGGAYAGGFVLNSTSGILKTEINFLRELICRDNIVFNVNSSQSGNARNQPYLLYSASLGHAGAHIGRTSITGNQVGINFIGTSTDMCGLWRNEDCATYDYECSRNQVRITWTTTAGGATWLDGSIMRLTSSTTNLGYVNYGKFDGNQVEIRNISGTDYTVNAIFIDNTGTGVVVNMSIQGNTFFSDSSSKFDYIGAWGIHIPSYTHQQFALHGNNFSSYDPIFLPDAWRFRYNGAIPNQLGLVTGGGYTRQFTPQPMVPGTLIIGNNGLYTAL